MGKMVMKAEATEATASRAWWGAAAGILRGAVVIRHPISLVSLAQAVKSMSIGPMALRNPSQTT